MSQKIEKLKEHISVLSDFQFSINLEYVFTVIKKSRIIFQL